MSADTVGAVRPRVRAISDLLIAPWWYSVARTSARLWILLSSVLALVRSGGCRRADTRASPRSARRRGSVDGRNGSDTEFASG